MPDAMIKLKKSDFLLFLDTHTSGTTATWSRIDRSTIFSLDLNGKSETEDFIAYETPVTTATGYELSMSQEITITEGNPIYDFLFEKLYNLDIGDAMMVKSLLCFGGSGKKAWQVDMTTITLKSLNTVDGKLTFDLAFGGTPTKGTYTISSGTPTFTPANSGSGD